MTGILLVVLFEGYKTCQRGDKRTRAADVYSEQKLAVIFRKLWKQNGRGDVTDELAGKGWEDQRIYFQKIGEEASNRFDPCHISGEYKEEDESE